MGWAWLLETDISPSLSDSYRLWGWVIACRCFRLALRQSATNCANMHYNLVLVCSIQIWIRGHATISSLLETSGLRARAQSAWNLHTIRSGLVQLKLKLNPREAIKDPLEGEWAPYAITGGAVTIVCSDGNHTDKCALWPAAMNI